MRRIPASDVLSRRFSTGMYLIRSRKGHTEDLLKCSENSDQIKFWHIFLIDSERASEGARYFMSVGEFWIKVVYNLFRYDSC